MPTTAHTTQTQTTGYYCGPAATRVALSARDQTPTQAALAAELGTTINGTDSSVDIARVLNAHLGAGTYGVRFIAGQSAIAAQIATLAADLVAAVDAGFALVANVAGTVRALNGRNYAYPGGHYVAVVGYNGDAAQVADVAVGSDYWTTTMALADWIATRGYAYPLITSGGDDMGAYERNTGWLLQNGVLELEDPATIPVDDTEGSEVQGQVPNKLAQKLDAILTAAKAAGAPSQDQVNAAVKTALSDPAVVAGIAKAVNDDAAARLAQ